MNAAQRQAERNQALQALAELLGSFSEQGLRTLSRAAGEGRLIRGQWKGPDGGLRQGCPLSCADGVLGGATAQRFAWKARERNAFVHAWDKRVLTPADVAGLALAELAWRESRPVGRLEGALQVVGAWARSLVNPALRNATAH